jgi:hypothetical protein
MANPNDNRPTWRPFSEYIERWGERRRAEGHEAPDVAPPEYWAERAKWRRQQNIEKDK